MGRSLATSAAYQLPFFPELENDLGRVVNVAQVVQLSPFRYPGGKTWLIPRFIQWLLSFPGRPAQFIEPFAGGGIVSLTAAHMQLADHVTMVELDPNVSAVWQTMLSDHAEWLANEVASFDLTAENVEARFKAGAPTIYESGFQTLLRNRILHGGILAPGSGVLKYGENGRGIRSRWYPETLKKRILKVATLRDCITFINGEGIQVMRDNAHRKDAVFFIDPPYTAAGKKAGSRLYTHFDLDHEELFRVTATLAGDFLMTYDDAAGVRDLARKHGFKMRTIAMKNTHHAEMKELLIGRNLDWVGTQASKVIE
jgi:DNA adenine methylase